MTKSGMASSIVLPMAMPIHAPVSGVFPFSSIAEAIRRTFIPLDPVAQSYYKLLKPVTLTGDFDIEIGFATTNETSGMMLLSGGTSTSGFELYKTTTGGLSVWQGGSSKGGASINIADGKLHTIKLERRGASVGIYVDGIYIIAATGISGDCSITVFGHRDGGLFYTDAILSDPIITDKSGAEDVVTTFELGNARPDTLYTYGADRKDLTTVPSIGTGWSVTDTHKYSCDGTNTTTSTVTIGDTLSVGKNYEISVKVSNHVQGNFRINTSTGNSPQQNGNGVVTWIYSNAASVNFNLQGLGASSQFDVEVLSVKEITNYNTVQANKNIELSKEAVLGGELWVNPVLGDWVEDSGSYSLVNAGEWAPLSISGLEIEKSYVVTFQCITPENILSFRGTAIYGTANEGVVTIAFTADNATFQFVRNSPSIATNMTVSNVSVKELITGNVIEYINIDDAEKEVFEFGDGVWVGEELITNGGFDTDSDWTLTSATISGGKINFGAGTAYGDQEVLDIGNKYRVSASAVPYVSDILGFSSVSFDSSVYISESGEFNGERIAKHGTLRVVSTADGNKLDNVSVKRLLELP